MIFAQRSSLVWHFFIWISLGIAGGVQNNRLKFWGFLKVRGFYRYHEQIYSYSAPKFWAMEFCNVPWIQPMNMDTTSDRSWVRNKWTLWDALACYVLHDLIWPLFVNLFGKVNVRNSKVHLLKNLLFVAVAKNTKRKEFLNQGQI